MSRAYQGSSLAARLAAGLFLPMLLAVLALVVAWSGLDTARTQLDEAHNRVMPALKTVYATPPALHQAAALQASWLVADTREERGVLAAQWSAHGDWLKRRVRRYEALDATDAQNAYRFSQALAVMLTAQGRVMSGEEPGRSPELAQAAARDALSAALAQAEVWQRHAEQWENTRADTSAQNLSARDVLTAALLMAALALALIQWQRLTHELSEPLRQSANALKALSTGRFDFTLPVGTMPETARLAERIDALREVVAFACDTDDDAEDLLIADGERLAITARALARYRYANTAAAPLVVTADHTSAVQKQAANDALALPA